MCVRWSAFHGYKFSLTDGCCIDNDFAVGSYRVEVRDAMLYVRLPRTI
ncbi:MAG: hypothetical protein WA740_05405 [Candidatus Binataceae bacterium]